MANSGPVLECRMYESEFPEPDEVVVVLVKEIQDMGAYVHLLEYNNCEGMIMLSELSRRRIRSVNKLLKVGHQEYAAVVRVDSDKGYIDLSKRRVAKEDFDKVADKWSKSRTVHSIVRHVAETVGVDMEELYKRWGWPLYKKYPHAYDGLRIAVNDPDAVLAGLDITPRERDELLRNVSRRLTPQAIKLRADIEVTCFGFEGIDAVKFALAAGEAASTEECPIKIKLVAPPLYVVSTAASQKVTGIGALNVALEHVKNAIVSKHGKFVCKVEPRTVSDKDEKQLASMMNELEQANKQVAGDSDSDASSDDGL
jgi:translation initiation factor 2 subunit 1